VGINVFDDLARALFYTKAAAGAFFVIDMNTAILHREGIFRARLDTAVAADAAHFAYLTHYFAFFSGVAGYVGAGTTGYENDYIFGANRSALSTAGTLVVVNHRCIPARPRQCPKGASINAVAKTQTAVTTVPVSSTIKRGSAARRNSVVIKAYSGRAPTIAFDCRNLSFCGGNLLPQNFADFVNQISAHNAAIGFCTTFHHVLSIGVTGRISTAPAVPARQNISERLNAGVYLHYKHPGGNGKQYATQKADTTQNKQRNDKHIHNILSSG
jgi:hypothetical protein